MVSFSLTEFNFDLDLLHLSESYNVQISSEFFDNVTSIQIQLLNYTNLQSMLK